MPIVHCRAEMYCLSVLSCWMMHSCCLEWTTWLCGLQALLLTHAGSWMSELEMEILFPCRVRQMSGSSVSCSGWPWESASNPKEGRKKNTGGGGVGVMLGLLLWRGFHKVTFLTVYSTTVKHSKETKLLMQSGESWIDHQNYVHSGALSDHTSQW